MIHHYAIDLGLFPFAGLLAGGLLYAVYYWVMRLKCSARAGQAYIVAAMLVSTLFAIVSLARTTERDLPAVTTTEIPDPERYTTELYYHDRLPYQGYLPEQAGQAAAADGAAARQQQAVMQAPEPTADAAETKPTLGQRWRTTVETLFANAIGLLGMLWLLGFVAVVGYFFVQLAYLYWYRHRQRLAGREGRAVIYETAVGTLPFSFGRNVFMPASLSDEVRQYVLMHELSHVRHRHFLKLCLLELVLAVNWWNPFVWLMFGEMRMQQEMEVDTDVLQQGVDRRAYQLSLVSVCTEQGKWILMQSAFLGGPLKKRLLFMNTPINPRRAQLLIASTVAVAALLVVLMVTVSCRARQRAKTHPLEGCWELEWLKDTGEQYGTRYGNRNLKFFGDYGELVLTYDTSDGANIPYFSLGGMDQRVHNDTLLDAHGRPIEYHLKDDGRLIWRWLLLPGEEANYPDGIDHTEQWRRIKPDQELTDLFLSLSQADRQQSRQHRLNGVWELDSTVTVYNDNWIGVTTKNRQQHLMINDPYYMRLTYAQNVNKEVWNFGGDGDCGQMQLLKKGRLILQHDTLQLTSPDTKHIILSQSVTINGGKGTTHSFYHRTDMPDYLRRIFGPALAVAEAEKNN